MKHEFGHVDGLCNIFANREDMLNSRFKPEVAKSLDRNSTIYVRCTPEDAEIFGEQFIGGTTWVVTHGLVFGDEGARALLRYYDKGTSPGEIRPPDTIIEAIAKLDNRSEASSEDWLIVP